MTASELSLIMLCYDEAGSLERSVRELLAAFERAGIGLQLVGCDNGSSDGSGELLAALARSDPRLEVHRIVRNRGYGNGVIESLPKCTAPWVGYLPADGQVAAEDVVRLFEAVRGLRGEVLGKVRRNPRADGELRAGVSAVYNFVARCLWPGIGSRDLNGIPKILRRETLLAMRLASRDWLLDPELMIKARAMRLRVVEIEVASREREAGRSHVAPGVAWTFLHRLIAFRLGGLPWGEPSADADREPGGATPIRGEERP